MADGHSRKFINFTVRLGLNQLWSTYLALSKLFMSKHLKVLVLGQENSMNYTMWPEVRVQAFQKQKQEYNNPNTK